MLNLPFAIASIIDGSTHGYSTRTSPSGCGCSYGGKVPMPVAGT
jgi:hypothetical protein